MRPDDVLEPTTVQLACRVTGCGAVFEIPVVYRLEYRPGLPPPQVELGREMRAFLDTRVVVDIDATLDLEAPLRAHLDEHATNAETIPDLYSPSAITYVWPDEPPSWPEVEWCDWGASCEHDACLDYADQIARDETRAAADPADCERCGA